MFRLALPARAAFSAAAVLGLQATTAGQLLFGPATSTPLPLGTIGRFAAGDVNGDGFDDLVVGHTGAPGLRLGDGSGGFGAESLIATDTFGATVALADLNHDGRRDLLVGTSLAARLSVSIALPGGGFAPAVVHPLGVTTTTSNFLSIDVRDGGVLALTAGPFGGPAGEARVFRHQLDGSLVLVNVVVPGAPPDRFASGLIGDLNADTRPDVVLLHNASLGFPQFTAKSYLCQPDDSFVQAWSLTDVMPARLAGLDLDNHVDLLTVGLAGQMTVVTAQLGAGDGTFTPGPVTSFSPSDGLAVTGVVDLDMDYIHDLVVSRVSPAEMWALHGVGDGSFVRNAHVSLTPPLTGLGAGAGLLGDFDGDGHLSLDALTPVGIGSSTPGVRVCLNRTYHHGAPPLDLGQQLKGSRWPIQIAEGSFVAGQPFAFELWDATPSGAAVLIAGLSALNAPFKGGTLVPQPLLVSGPLRLSPAGSLSVGGPAWPGGPLGLTLLLQFWFADPGGPAGFAASSAVQITLP